MDLKTLLFGIFNFCTLFQNIPNKNMCNNGRFLNKYKFLGSLCSCKQTIVKQSPQASQRPISAQGILCWNQDHMDHFQDTLISAWGALCFKVRCFLLNIIYYHIYRYLVHLDVFFLKSICGIHTGKEETTLLETCTPHHLNIFFYQSTVYNLNIFLTLFMRKFKILKIKAFSVLLFFFYC